MDRPHLIGRRTELATLRAVLAGAGEHHHAFVVGEAGIGKTRLVDAACAAVVADGVLVVGGACLPLSESMPLLPIGDVLRSCAVADGGRLLESALAATDPFVSEAVARLLAATPDDTEQSSLVGARQQAFVAVRLVLSAMAARRPLALLIEDVHWADSSTVDLLEYLLVPAHAIGVPIVMTFRDHPSSERSTPARALLDESMRQVGVLRIALGALHPDEVSDQIAGLTGEVPEPRFSAGVYARSQGNPFFTEQLVAHLSDAAHPDELPPGLAALLLTRVAGLDETAADLVAALAVAARPLDEDDLATVCSLSSPEVRSGMRSVHRRGLLRPHPDGYDLRHQLLAQAVSADLLPPHRRDLHRAVGDVLAGRPGDLFAAEAAEHYERAGAVEPELQARVRAAKHAERVFAWDDAERHWRRALTCYGPTVPRPDDHERAWQIYAGLHLALRARGASEAHEVAREAYELLARYSDPLQCAELCLNRGFAAETRSIEESIALFDEGLRACEGMPSRILVRLLLATESQLQQVGRITEAADTFRRALAVATTIGDPQILARLDATQTYLWMRSGDDDKARAGVARLLERLPDVPGWDMPLYLGMTATDVLLKLGDLPAVVTAARRPLEIADARGVTDNSVTCLLRWNLGDALTELGRATDAAVALERVPDRAPNLFTMWDHVGRAHLAMLRGELPGAHVAWKELDTLDLASINFRIEYVQRRVELDLWRDAPADALDPLVRVLDAAGDTDESAYTGIVLLLAIRACADLAEHARARQDHDALADATRRGSRVAELHAGMLIDPFTVGPMRVTADASRATWDAESARLAGAAATDLWATAAAQWTRHGRPHRAAYALWRQAEDMLHSQGRSADSAATLTRANELAAEHVPLRAAITALARRARIELVSERAEPEVQVPSLHAAPFGLTGRELEVLALVADGLSNPEIGVRLFMSPKTASVHVSNILRKLQVTTRAHAASVATRAGVLRD